MSANANINPTDFIIDFETLGITDDAVILSCGILEFPAFSTDKTDILRDHGFYVKMNREEQSKLGRDFDKPTLDWWIKQGDSAKEVLSNTDCIGILQAYHKIKDFFMKFNLDNCTIWSRGLIDQRWWQSFVQTVKKLDPNVDDFLPFWKWRDIRTFIDTYISCTFPQACLEDFIKDMDKGLAIKHPELVKHNALDDCCLDYLRFQYMFHCNEHVEDGKYTF